MKKTDIAMIMLITSISLVVSYFVVGSIPALQGSNEPVDVEVIDKYSATIDDIDPTIFNGDAINPTVEVNIGDTETSE